MNILNVTSIKEWRGGEAQLYMYFKLLQEYDDLNQMILCPENAALFQKCKKNDYKCFTYKNKHKVLSLIQPIVTICKTQKIDIIHVHDSSALTASLIASIFLPKTTKIVLSRKRNNAIKDKFINRLKYSHPRIIKILSVSKAVEKIFDNIIEDKSRLVTIYDSIDVSYFKGISKKNIIHNEFGLSLNTKIVGNVAALTSQKDIHTFIATAKKIIAKKESTLDVKFAIIGDGPLKEELIEYAKTNQIEDEIIFMGYRTNVNEILPDFDVFLLTSETEGLPLTIYEAFASKVPVVATNAGGISEVVKNNTTGFVTDLKDSDNLSNHVLNILQDEELSNHIKSNAFKLVSDHHDLSNMKKNYYTFYSSINNK